MALTNYIILYFTYLCHRIVDINGWCLQLLISEHPVQIIDTSSSLLRDATDTCR